MKGKLVVISHTEHYHNEKGDVVGWGPTVRELNYLSNHFSSITHIATLHDKPSPNSSQGYSSQNIKFIALQPFGGHSIFAKLRILSRAIHVIRLVHQEVKDAEYVQLRTPTGIAAFLLCYFALTKNKRKYTFWVKYAGNWNQTNPPLGYRFQRWFLKRNFCDCKVTINGKWPNQPEHCISFENPCLTQEQIQHGRSIASKKTFKSPYHFIFIGRIEEAKGVDRILNAIEVLDKSRVASVTFIGDGPNKEKYQERAKNINTDIRFLGGLDNESVHQQLEQADFLLLPSNSEGFPKVIAEAACYGVIPVVSDVGSIGHYINEENGYVCKIEIIDSELSRKLQEAIKVEPHDLSEKSQNLRVVAIKFSFDEYRNSLDKYIFLNG